MQTYHQMGRCWTKSPPLHAGVHPQSPHPIPTPPLTKQQDQPYPHVKPNYGAKKQYAQEDDDSPALNKAGKKSSKRSAKCSFSSHGGLLPTLSSLASQQANPTEKTMGLCKQFLDFMSTQEEAVLTIEQATWSSQSTATRRTSPSPNHAAAAAAEATCSWQEKTKSPSTMGPSSTSRK